MEFNLKRLTVSSICLFSGMLSCQGMAAQGWSLSGGIYASAGRSNFQYTATNQYSTTITDDDDSDATAAAIVDSTDLAKQNNFGIGYVLHADRFFHQDQFWGIEVDSQNFGNSTNLASSWNISVGAWYVDDHSNLPENIENKFQMENQTNFSLAYGFELDQQGNWLYMKVGPSVARIKESAVSSIDIYNEHADDAGYGDRFLSSNINNSSSKQSIWGGGFGLGLRHYFNKRVMLFAEYNYYYYGNLNISTLSQAFSLDTVDGNNTLTSTGGVTRKVKISSSSFKTGLAIVF